MPDHRREFNAYLNAPGPVTEVELVTSSPGGLLTFKALKGRKDRWDNEGRIEYDGVAFETGPRPRQVRYTVVVQYTQKTKDGRYDAGRGQRIGVVNAFCHGQPRNKCPDFWRDLTRTNPAHQPDLAGSLSNVGIRLSAVGRREEALTATEEAVAGLPSAGGGQPGRLQPRPRALADYLGMGAL
ncbi:hypothetical protein ACWDZX_12465 [Streptomyces collinus]